MLVKDKLLSGNFFGELAKHGEIPFIDGESIPMLNNLLLLDCGDKPLFSKLNDYDLELITGFIYTLHHTNWLRLIELQSLTTEDVNGRKLTETVTNNESRTHNRNELNKVSGYNSDELLTNDGLEVNGDDDLTGNKVRVLEDKKLSLRSLYSDLSLTQKNSIINRALRDINIFLSTSIY